MVQIKTLFQIPGFMPLHVARRVHKLPFHHVQTGLMPPAKHHMPFNKAHITEFGLKIMERDPNTKAIVSVHCQFCVFNSREELHPEKVRKRVKTDTIMSWQAIFRTDYY